MGGVGHRPTRIDAQGLDDPLLPSSAASRQRPNGDVLAGRRGCRGIEILGDGDSGEFSGQTRFLMAAELNKGWPEIARRTRVRVVPRFTALALMTDGVSDPKFATDKKLRDPAAWRAFWQDDLGPALTGDPEALLKWLEFWSPGEHDDRTLVLLY